MQDPWRDHLTEIVEAIAAGVAVYNTKGQFMFANPEAARIIGLKPTAMIGRSFDDPGWKVMTPDGQVVRPEERTLIRVMKTGKPVYGREAMLERPDGSRVFVSTNGAPLINAAGDISAIVISAIDVTALKIAEQELQRAKRKGA